MLQDELRRLRDLFDEFNELSAELGRHAESKHIHRQLAKDTTAIFDASIPVPPLQTCRQFRVERFLTSLHRVDFGKLETSGEGNVHMYCPICCQRCTASTEDENHLVSLSSCPGMTFNTECLGQWLRTSPYCPLTRTRLF